MLIDESLAQGLSKQFIANLDDDFEMARKILTKKINNNLLSSRTGFNKYASFHKEAFKNFTLSHQIGGSKRQPYLGEIVLNTKRDREYNDWTEGAVYGQTNITILSPNNSPQNSSPSVFLIGEHAISRIYQRSNLFKSVNKIDPYLIVPELSLIPFWACFWVYLLSEMSDLTHDKKLGINPVIPSPQGLFFCKLTKVDTTFLIEIRTYVHDSTLSELQKQVRNSLINISKNLENSILCLFPNYINTPNMERSHFEFMIVIMQTFARMRGKTYEICETLLPEQNVCDVYELHKSIDRVIDKSSFAENDCTLQNKELNKKGYRVWMYDFIEHLMMFKSKN